MATRHKVKVGLNLPSLIWKPLVGVKLSFDDLVAVDANTAKGIHQLLQCSDLEMKQTDSESLLESLNYYLPPGNDITFTFDDHGVYATTIGGRKLSFSVEEERKLILQEVMKYQLEGQYRDAVRSLYDGFGYSLPTELFQMFTETEIEALVCGQPYVDVNLLQKVTEYSDGKETYIHKSYLQHLLWIAFHHYNHLPVQ